MTAVNVPVLHQRATSTSRQLTVRVRLDDLVTEYEVLVAHSRGDFKSGKWEKAVQSSDASVVVSALHTCSAYTFVVRVTKPSRGKWSDYVDVASRKDPTAPPKHIKVETVHGKHGGHGRLPSKWQYRTTTDKPETIHQFSEIIKVNVSWENPCGEREGKLSYTLNVTLISDGGAINTTSINVHAGLLKKTLHLEKGGTYNFTLQVKNDTVKTIPSIPKQLLLDPYDAPDAICKSDEEGVWVDAVGERMKDFMCEFWVQERGKPDKVLAKENACGVLTEISSGDGLVHHGGIFAVSVRKYRTFNYVKFYSSESIPCHIELGGVDAAPAQPINLPTSNKTALYVGASVGGVVLFVLVALLTVWCVKHRRLQRSFLSFTSSHYNSRTENATFSGEDEDSPMIQGFSDDEPLVMA